MDNNIKIGSKIGAGVGVAVWFLFGILAGFYFGGYGAISIMSKLAGGPVEATLINKSLVVFGMAVGISAMGTMCLVVGGLLGSSVGFLTSTLSPKKVPVIQ